MRIRRSYVLAAVALVFGATLVPAVSRTIRFTGDASELVLLASIPESQHSFNPWYWDSYLVSPEMAVWILENFDWPYEEDRSGWLGAPIYMTVVAHSFENLSPTDKDRLFRLLGILIDRGELIDEYGYEEAFTPLLSATFSCDQEAVELLLNAGANPNLPVVAGPRSSFRKLDGMNAVEVADYMRSRDDYCQSDIHGFLLSKQGDK